MERFAGYPFELYVGDVGSHDGSIEMLRKLESQGRLTAEVSVGWRQHHEWIDRWLRNCDKRYAVFVDSDVVFLKPDWLRDLVSTATSAGAALVCAEFQPELAGYVDPGSKRVMRVAARPAAHVLLLDAKQTRAIEASFAPRFEDSADVPEGALNYDLAGLFFIALEEARLRWVEMPAGYRARYRHFGGMSWRPRKVWGGWAAAKRTVKIHVALLLYRTVWRTRPGSRS